MFNWIVSDIQQYLEIELFDHLTVCMYKMCLQIIYI